MPPTRPAPRPRPRPCPAPPADPARSARWRRPVWGGVTFMINERKRSCSQAHLWGSGGKEVRAVRESGSMCRSESEGGLELGVGLGGLWMTLPKPSNPALPAPVFPPPRRRHSTTPPPPHTHTLSEPPSSPPCHTYVVAYVAGAQGLGRHVEALEELDGQDPHLCACVCGGGCM